MVQPAPRFNKQALDLDAFWSIVVQKYGGYDSVCQNKLWASVARVMGASAGMTNASFCIRRLYERCLLPYERYKLQGTAPSPTKSWPNSMPADDGEEEGGLSGCSQQEAPGPTSSGGSLQRGRPARSNRGRHSRWGDEMLDWEEVRRRPRSRRASGEEGRTRWSVLGPGESQECSQSQAAHGLTEADDDEADETEALDTTWISGYHVRLGGDSPGARRSGLIVSYDAAADKHVVEFGGGARQSLCLDALDWELCAEDANDALAVQQLARLGSGVPPPVEEACGHADGAEDEEMGAEATRDMQTAVSALVSELVGSVAPGGASASHTHAAQAALRGTLRQALTAGWGAPQHEPVLASVIRSGATALRSKSAELAGAHARISKLEAELAETRAGLDRQLAALRGGNDELRASVNVLLQALVAQGRGPRAPSPVAYVAPPRPGEAPDQPDRPLGGAAVGAPRPAGHAVPVWAPPTDLHAPALAKSGAGALQPWPAEQTIHAVVPGACRPRPMPGSRGGPSRAPPCPARASRPSTRARAPRRTRAFPNRS
ncbi:hypothetical protein QBZ16_003714 [Prototheca wickerhamii]|uniref:ARID domain-containing protein n=1 Tax=Prototheca wickerhamii TaxID=3111 RepID=A0AAD9IHQ2_PROWI|nr:hypothetical protein QBZ16_003714 [Prototheca wickerhamii]